MNNGPLTSQAYASHPLHFQDGMPVFSSVDTYVENYQKIAHDHVEAIRPGHANPFMETQLWEVLEDSTRALLKKYVPSGSRVLDVGVGLGRVLGSLDQYQRFGIDISFDYLSRAREQGIEVAFSKIEDMPFVDGYFDAVLVCDVLEHVFDLNYCCAQILRVLRPGGVLLVRVPYREDLSAYLSKDLPYEYVHLRNFDEYSLKLFFEKIMRCVVVEMAQVAPVLQGPPRMKLRQLPLSSPIYELMKTFESEVDTSQVHSKVNDVRQELRQRSTVEKVVNRLLKVLGLPSLDDHKSLESEIEAMQAAQLADRRKRDHPLALLKSATSVSEDEFTNWVYNLRDNHRQWYDKIAGEITYGLEVNVVVRKADEASISTSPDPAR